MGKGDLEKGIQSNKEKEPGDQSANELSPESRMIRVFNYLRPEVKPMRPSTEEAIIQKVLAIQRSKLEGQSAGERKKARGRTWAPKILVPAAVATLAAVLIILVLTLTGQQAVPPSRYVATIAPEGKIRVSFDGDIWHTLEGGKELTEGYQVRTLHDSRAYIHFEDGSRARLDRDSSLALVALEEEKVELEHAWGSSYHRVQKGTGYVVAVSDVSVTAKGTAFNITKTHDEKIEVLTVEDEVEVTVAKRGKLTVAQGQELVVSEADEETEVKAIPLEKLEEEWLLTSMKEDVEAGYDPGVYADVGISLEEEVHPEETETTTPPGETREPEQEPSPAEIRVELSGRVVENYTVLHWSVSSSTGFDSIAVLRSEGRAPVYPGDKLFEFPGSTTISCADTQVTAGHTYNYQVTLLSGSVPDISSNIFAVTVPDPRSLVVKAEASGDTVLLSWNLTSPQQFNAYVVCRSEVTSHPVSPPHPGDASIRLNTNQESFDYRDNTVISGKTYHYRIALVSGDAVLFYSGPVTVALP